MNDLSREIAIFETYKLELERTSQGKWVIVYGNSLAGNFDNFDQAAESAVARFGRGPYLIRQVGAPEIVLPASVMYIVQHA